MALQKTITTTSGLVATDSYLRIDLLSGSKSGIDLTIGVYVSTDSVKNHMPAADTKFYHFVPSVSDDSTNFIKQGYVYLKTLDEFANATDC